MARPQIKTLSAVGFPALCGHVKSVQTTAKKAAEGVQQLSDALNQSVQEIEAVINDFPVAASITILTTGWNQSDDTSLDFPYYYDIPAKNVDENDLPVITIAPQSQQTTADCGFCPTCESFNGKVRVYSKDIPDTAISAELFVIGGQAGNFDDEEENSGE